MNNVQQIREQFPILSQQVHGKPLIYFDHAATTQKPLVVLAVMGQYYRTSNANVHRGVHSLSAKATEQFEHARKQVANFLNAPSEREIVFTKGCTESINLVAASWGRTNLKEGDEVILSTMEHHSNIVPWQLVCETTGACLKVIPLQSEKAELDLDVYQKLLTPRTKLVGVVHVSNALGTINPVKKITELAHQYGAKVLIDGAQACAHLKVDVQDLNADFYTLSGHKVFGPTGIGALFAKQELLEQMPPYQGGGEMIRMVRFDQTTYNEIPFKFEAGTPNIAGAIGLGKALTFVEEYGWDWILETEEDLKLYALDQLQTIEGLKVIGSKENSVSLISFVMDGVHPHDIGTVLDLEGVAIRTGHHCCMPLMQALGVPATARASLSFYNTKDEIDVFITGLKKVQEMFK